jgi:hypothetical protein
MIGLNRFQVVLIAALYLLGLSTVALSATAPALTQSHSGGGVTVKAIYVNPQAADGTRFQILLDTHSIDLDGYDLKALSSLRDAAGKTYQPIRVENKGSGHHREVALIFLSLSPEANQIELVVKDVAGVKERKFRWDRK